MSEVEFIKLWLECFGGTATPLNNVTVIAFTQWMREADNSALRSQVAELQRQLDKAAKQEPVAWLWPGDAWYKAALTTVKAHADEWPVSEPLYRLPPNLPALIEQARDEEREAIKLAVGKAIMSKHELAHSCVDYVLGEIDEDIRARKP